MSVHYRIGSDIAWVEGETGGLSRQVVWLSQLDTGVQYELTGTGWLIWVLIAADFTQPEALLAELERIRAESDSGDDPNVIDMRVLRGFLTDLERDGLLTREE